MNNTKDDKNYCDTSASFEDEMCKFFLNNTAEVSVVDNNSSIENMEILLFDGDISQLIPDNEIQNIDKVKEVISVNIGDSGADSIVENEVNFPTHKCDNIVNSVEATLETVTTLNDEESPEKPRLTRKRAKNTTEWKLNKRKYRRENGLDYEDRKGKVHTARAIKGGCRPKCSHNCMKVISNEERKTIFEHFWNLPDTKKSHFYSKYVKRTVVSRRRGKLNEIKKNFTYQYYFNINNNTIQVCKEYFLSTLNISSRRIYYCFNKILHPTTSVPRSPLKGKQPSKNVVAQVDKDVVRNHISSFATIESHYCRANTNRKYLDSSLSITKMYSMYLESLPAGQKPVKQHMYAKIFNEEFNLSFFRPKKDLCDKCVQYKLNLNKTKEDIQEYEIHMKRKAMGREEKNNDRSIKDDETAVITFDLQNVFALPESNVSINFYKRKLNCYNLTAHCSRNNVTYCSIWHEYLSGRAGNHIASAIIKILNKVILDNPELKKIILWSDSCVPQNKNSIMSLAIQQFLNLPNNLESIEQKFSEPGHGNLQEVDCVHSVIEKFIRHREIHSPLSLLRILLSMPKTNKTTLQILQMQTSDFFNYQTAANSLNYSNVPYTKVKHIVYKQNSNSISYRNSFDEAFRSVKIIKSFRSSRSQNLNNDILPVALPLTEVNVGLTVAKKKDLESMLPLMNQIDREFYQAIFSKSRTNLDNEKNKTKKKESNDKVKNNSAKKKLLFS